MNHIAVAEKIKDAGQLFEQIGKLDPMEDDQVLLLQAMEILGKTRIMKQYQVLHLATFGE